MKVSHQRIGGASSMAAFASAAVLALACTAEVKGPHQGSGGSNGGGSNGAGSAGTVGVESDPGWVPIHRLNNAEYNNAVADLLGTTLRPADFFQAQTATGFNTNHGALANPDAAGARAYFDAARAVVEDVFANPALKAQVVTCQPPDAADTACASGIIESFGRRAWRRPLAAGESQSLLARYGEARTALEKDHDGAIAHVLRIMLTAAPFTYFIERDPDVQAAAQTKRPLQGYELAQRLSLVARRSAARSGRKRRARRRGHPERSGRSLARRPEQGSALRRAVHAAVAQHQAPARSFGGHGSLSGLG
jgi:hypothetical protein